MACENCKKTKLNSCEECDFTVNTDCVEFTGDKLCVEEGIVRDGSSRTLTSVLEALDDLCDCAERVSKIVDGDYQIILEDACKVLLLDGELSDDPENVTYTITLPSSSSGASLDFINKTLIFKDISEQQSPSGNVLWNFDQSIKYDWENELSTTSFETLSHSLHKVVWLQFLKHPDNIYKWTAVSPNSIDYSGDITDLQDQIDDISGLVSPIVGYDLIEYEDSDFSDTWANHALTVEVQKIGYTVYIRGYIKDGHNNSSIFTLPAGFRPPRQITLTTQTDQQATVAIIISHLGIVTIIVDGFGVGDLITGYVSLSGLVFNTI